MGSAPRSLYLDSNDLSHLAKGRGPGGPERTARQRESLRRLIEESRVRLFVSFVHLAEMAVDDETRETARNWLGRLPEVWCFTTSADDIFRAELRNEPLVIQANQLTNADLEKLRVPTRLGVEVGGVQVARFIKSGSRVAAWGERMSRKADRRGRDDGTAKHQEETVRRFLAGDVSGMPRGVRLFARGFLWLAPKLLDRFAGGRTLADLSNEQQLTKHGLAWATPLVEPGHRIRPDFVAPTNASRAPACALRAAIERREARDLSRNPASGTHYDVRHVAYAAHCDVATFDSANFDATKRIREAISRPTIFRGAALDDVLHHLRSPHDVV